MALHPMSKPGRPTFQEGVWCRSPRSPHVGQGVPWPPRAREGSEMGSLSLLPRRLSPGTCSRPGMHLMTEHLLQSSELALPCAFSSLVLAKREQEGRR